MSTSLGTYHWSVYVFYSLFAWSGHSRFKQIHKIGHALFAVSFFFSNHIVLDITGYERITFQGKILLWSSKFQMSQSKTKLATLAFLCCGEFVKTSSSRLLLCTLIIFKIISFKRKVPCNCQIQNIYCVIL